MTVKNNKSLKTIELNGKRIKFRKWKGKDKKKFIQQIREIGLENVSLEKTMNILVHGALESHKDEIFTQEEYRYLLSRIRQFSLGNDMLASLFCDNCGEEFLHEYKISEVVKPIHETLDDFDDGDVFIKFGKIKNKEMYLEQVQEDKNVEIFYRIEEFNGSRQHSIDSLMQEFDDLDLVQIEEIIDFYESNKFQIDDIKEIKCPHCNHTTDYEFDEIPDFFPQSWFEEAFKDMMQALKEKQTQDEIREIFGMNEEE